jgi:hypothetical protein
MTVYHRQICTIISKNFRGSLYLLVGASEYSDLNLQWKQDTPNCDVISAGTWKQNTKMISYSPNKRSSW